MSTSTSFVDREAVDRVVARLYAVMKRAWDIDSRPQTFDTDGPLTRAEIHTVEAIARHPGCNAKTLAAHLEVTKGAVSQMVTRLIAKGLVRKAPAPDSNREITLTLTETGDRAKTAHDRYHETLALAFKTHFGTALPDRLPDLEQALDDLLGVMATYDDLTTLI